MICRLLLATIFLIGTAHAQVGPIFAVQPVASPPAYAGPGDIKTFTAWYGLRAYTAAIAAAGTQKLFNARRVSDGEKCDFLVATSGGIGLSTSCTGADNGVSLTTFMTSTTAFVTEWYDQTGGGRPLLQATTTSQPQIILNCINTTLPCFQITATPQALLTSGNFTPATGVMSYSVVGNRVTNDIITNNFIRMSAGQNTLSTSGTNQWKLFTNSNTLNFTANSNAWHACNAVINGASSVANLDGTETSGTVVGSTTAGTIQIPSGQNTSTDQIVEAGFIDNVVLSSGDRTNLRNQQHSYWATP